MSPRIHSVPFNGGKITLELNREPVILIQPIIELLFRTSKVVEKALQARNYRPTDEAQAEDDPVVMTSSGGKISPQTYDPTPESLDLLIDNLRTRIEYGSQDGSLGVTLLLAELLKKALER